MLMLLKIINIVGARPQFIKLAPILRAIEEHNQNHPECPIQEVLVHTGQHYDYEMSQVFFDELGLRSPDFHLGVGSGTHGYQTGEMLKRIEEVLLKEKPDMVMVYGDTNTTLPEALAAAKIHIPVAHVEAGLRSFNREMPEEINRVLTDHISDLLFCPTQTAVENLRREGIEKGVHLVGDVMYDAVLLYLDLAKKKIANYGTTGIKAKILCPCYGSPSGKHRSAGKASSHFRRFRACDQGGASRGPSPSSSHTEAIKRLGCSSERGKHN